MKRICLLLALILLILSFASCGGDDVTTTGKPNNDDITTIPEKKILSVEEMTELDCVSSVVKNEANSGNGCIIYDLMFDFNGVKIDGQMAIPSDYKTKNYPTLLYFADVMLNYQYLSYYASSGYTIIRFGYRSGADETQRRDACGEDYNDVKSFFEACKKCDFLSRGGLAVMGSAEGSVRALMLARDYSDEILGCAVIDVISDIESFMEFRGEGIKQLYKYRIGYSIEEKPEEYQKRSPVYFADKIDAPVLIFAYNNNPLIPVEQATMLKDAMLDSGGRCELRILNELSSDFMTESSVSVLLPWISELQASKGYAK